MRRAAPVANSSLPISYSLSAERRLRFPKRLALLTAAVLLLLLPPFVLESPRSVRATPTASGAEPAYPLNHTIDASIQSVGTPPANSGFSDAAYAVGTPPPNYDFSTAPQDAGTQPTNRDFEAGSFTGWTTTGTVTLQTATGQGNYAQFDASGAAITTDAFTVDSTAQELVVDIGFLSTSANSWVIVNVLSGSGYTTSTQIGSFSCGSCGRWETKYMDVTAFRGQSIKVKFSRGVGTQVSGVDNLRSQVVFPGFDTVGNVYRFVEANGNVYAGLDSGSPNTLTTNAFSVDSAAQFATVKAHGFGNGTDAYYVYVLSGPTYGTSTQMAIANVQDVNWETARFNVGAFQGQSIKIKIDKIGKLAIDDVFVSTVDVPQWTVTKDTRRETGGPGGDFVSTNGDLTSQPFTIPAGTQHLTLQARDPGSSAQFYVELLRGPTFSTVTDLAGGVERPTSSWQTFKYGVQNYGGETVKLRIRQWWGRSELDDMALMETVLPGWSLNTIEPIATGEDQFGTYASGLTGSAYLKSSLISTGVIDTTGVQMRFFAITYQHMGAQNAIVRASWYNTAGSSWVVSTNISSTADGIKTAYFYVADFMGDTGYFLVQVDQNSRFYSMADNVARQQLQEPSSHKVGLGIDTSTGSFGFADPDLQLEGRMPLNFRRFYTGLSDRYGALGYRWSSSYDTRLVFASNNDAGVIFGSGGEEFFDGNTSWVFTPVDPRVTDDLIKNVDGTFTFRTKLTFTYTYDAEGNATGVSEVGGGAASTSFDASGRLDGVGGAPKLTVNRSYNFNSGGVLISIVDLNGNTISLSYDGNGRLSTVTDPDARTLTLAYDANGRLSSVTAPDSAVVQYGYDGNGDLVSVTDPDGGVRSYSYSGHRLVQALDQDGDAVFTNAFDTVGRTATQTDAGGNAITVSYDTPAKGVTSVTDALTNTAVYYFDKQHRTTDKVDPLGRVLSYVYDANGRLQKVIDPINNQWQFAYDSSGGLSNLTDPLGNPMAITYGALHLPTTITDARGYTTSMTYDAKGNLLTLTNALGKTTTFTYDSAGNALTKTDPLGYTETYTYDSAGNRTTRTDPLGHTWTWTYDGSGRQTSETNPLGQTTSHTFLFGGQIAIETNPLGGTKYFGYAADGRLILVDDELGNRTQWGYDDRGLAITRTDPAGKVTVYGYDDNRRLESVSDPNGLTTFYEHNSAGQITSITDPTGAETGYAYDGAGRLTSMTDPAGRVSSYTYDDAGRWLSTTMPNGGVYANTYDPNGNLTVETDPLGRSYTYMYDALNRRTRETDPLLGQTNLTYDDGGRRTQVKGALNQTTDYVYDARSLLVSETDPLGGITSYGYDNAGRRLSVTDPVGRVTSFGYDSAGRLTSATNNAGQATTYTFDAAGRQTRITLSTGAQTNFAFDPRGLLTSETDALGNVISYGYDDGGRRTSMADGRGFVTAYGYDGAGRQSSITDALNGVVNFLYNAAGEMTSLTNANGTTTAFTYNPLGLQLTETDALGNVKSRQYDAAGQAASYTDARGNTQTFSYDGVGRLAGLSYPGGSVTRGYDAIGRQTAMTDSTGTTTWSYDAASRVTSVSAPGGAVSYTYNAAGDRTTMTLPGSRTVNYAYDTAGRLSSLTDWAAQVTSFGYNSNGWRTSIVRPNAVTSSYAYDSVGRPTSISHATPGGTILALSYTYDGNGSRTSETTNGSTESYTLDALNRLASVAHSGGGTTSYTYDANGNRLAKTTGGGTTTYTYNAGERLISDGISTYAYDADGNLTTRGTDTFSYDYAGRMTAATVSGASSTYAYDGDDIRVSIASGGTGVPQLWDRICSRGTCGPSCGGQSRPQVPFMVDDTASTYLWADGLVAEVSTGGTRLDDLTDGLGSVRAWSDSAASTAASASYDTFGAVTSSTGTPGQFRFTGEQWDSATGLEFLRARYYDAAVGRFMSADTVQPNAPGTQGWNRFAYVANNPTSWIDPTGHSAAPVVPWARGGALPENLAPYLVTVAAAAGLAALGNRLADSFTFLALVLSGAWVLVDIWQEVKDDDYDPCIVQWEINQGRCSQWARGNKPKHACCMGLARDRMLECRGFPGAGHKLPWEPGYDRFLCG